MNTTQQQTKTMMFANLFAAIKAGKERELDVFINSFDDADTPKTIEGLLNSWYYSDLLTATTKRKTWNALIELKSYLISRKRKAIAAYVEKQLKHLQAVESAPDLISITFNVEWKKSRMWGSNPRCEAQAKTERMFEHYDSGSISGCGYDKESTAIAQAANQCNSFLKALYLAKEQHADAKNHDLLGYGSGYGILPRLEGGVGTSCYPRIFEAIGFGWQHVGTGKTFDVYTATKK